MGWWTTTWMWSSDTHTVIALVRYLASSSTKQILTTVNSMRCVHSTLLKMGGASRPHSTEKEEAGRAKADCISGAIGVITDSEHSCLVLFCYLREWYCGSGEAYAIVVYGVLWAH